MKINCIVHRSRLFTFFLRVSREYAVLKSLGVINFIEYSYDEQKGVASPATLRSALDEIRKTQRARCGECERRVEVKRG